MSTFYQDEGEEEPNPLILEDTDEEYEEYTDEEDEEYVDLEEEEEPKLDEVPSNQVVKPDFTAFWSIMLASFIFFMLMSISTAYLSGNSWVVNNNIHDQIKGIKANINASKNNEISSNCLTCTDNGDGTYTTIIKSVMDVPSLANTQFTTGFSIDNIAFDTVDSNIESTNPNTLFLFDNNLGASNDIVSIPPGLISLPISSGILPSLCTSSYVFESSIYANIDVSNNLNLCVCDTTNNYCFQLL
jgi:hypothetical protein